MTHSVPALVEKTHGEGHSLGELLCHGAPNQPADNVSHHDAADERDRLRPISTSANFDFGQFLDVEFWDDTVWNPEGWGAQ